MADSTGSGSGLPNLNLSPEEKRYYGQLFKAADPDGFGVVSGDVAVKFFERTKLAPDVLGQIWQIADTENRGLLTPAGFGVVLRLVGHAQAGRTPSMEVASQSGPLPRFEGYPVPTAPAAPAAPAPAPLAAQTTGTPSSPTNPTGGPIRVPPLTPEKANEYALLFEKSGAENGLLGGVIAKQIFERARLPNDVLGRIWNLSDTQDRGALDTTEFVIAMHLLFSFRSGAMRGVPSTLPPGLYEAAARRGGLRGSVGSRPGSTAPPLSAQFTGQGRPQSPPTRPFAAPMSAQSTGDGWMITPVEKARFDQAFATVDTAQLGVITGDQAVGFFEKSGLDQDTLASIWDLADINGEGRLTKDEFAVAMYLIRQQKEGRGPLPQVLPPALVPPNMRGRQPPQPIQAMFTGQSQQAPIPAPAPPPPPKSAADDLFGLDAFSTPSSPPPAQIPQSTGSSAAAFQTPASPIHSIQPAATGSSGFKPFIPTSSFGQSIIPQNTGSPAPPSATRSPQPADDLLGDADPEVSSKLTHETTELANLSNQVGNLSKQMQEVQNTRTVTDQQLSQSSQQKREFETRLSQLRTLYEQEVKDVKVLEDQLNQSRTEVRRVQQEMAMLNGSYQDLKTQHQQLSAQVETEQRESASLKEKLRQMNAEVAALKPAVEKLKSDARQQKGLNAINRKQLATVEGERDRLQSEHETATKELEEARIEAQSASPVPVASSAVASPAPSSASQNNPFFRRQTTGTSETGFASPAAPRSVDPRDAFDNFFGSSLPATSATPPPPTTSFRSESPAVAVNAAALSASPSVSPPQVTHTESPRAVDPPAPPASRQLTSSALPFPNTLEKADSMSSSVKVAAPASRIGAGETPRITTPSASVGEAHSQAGSSPVEIEKADFEGSFEQATPTIAAPVPAPAAVQRTESTAAPEIPGAFPSFTPLSVSPAPPEAATEESAKDADTNFDHVFGSSAHARTPSEKAADFDAAFATLKGKDPVANGTAATSLNKEFPPIHEFDDGDDSDSSDDAPLGFDDNFTPASPKAAKVEEPTTAPTESAEKSAAGPSAPLALPIISDLARPSVSSTPSANSSLPGVDAQVSPPTYNEAVPKPDDNFPAEFTGLLPHREDPMTEPPHSVDSATGAPVERRASQDYGPELSKVSSHSIKSPAGAASVKSPPANSFDFDSAFANVNMSAAPAVEDSDDDDDDDFDTSFTAHGNSAEFDPSFESPAPKAAAPAPQAASNAFDDFDNFGSSVTASSPQPAAGAGSANNASHDWDAIFAGLDGPAAQTTSPPSSGFSFPEPAAPAAQPAPSSPTHSTTAPSSPPSATTLSAPKPSVPQRPVPGRALSMGTEHDDPILKRLTGMGWSRDESLKALEKYDYNLDKAIDYLTSKSS